ncbi:MAG: hypothetical protein OXN21_03150 [Chloroflexota bacterium]|nr:hypothetical protein [Chloroflexota bacterium]
MNPMSIRSRRVEVEASYDAIQDYYERQGWTDGLPVVPATEDLVRKMLQPYGQDPATSLGVVQPRNAEVTLEKVAINAVMAGCRPEYFPVVVAAVKAALQPDFNIAGVQATTGGAAPVVIVNGPVAQELEINGDSGCFGPGYRSNASIGRALRLFVRNVAGLIPGEMDKATLALPARYTFCFSENEARSPWEPLHVEMGLDPSASMVTLMGVRGMYTIMESTSPTGIQVLRTLVGSLRTIGVSNYYQTGTGAQLALVLCPEHAAEIHASGLTKQDVREYVFQNARMPLKRLEGIAHYGNRNWPRWIDESDPDAMIPIVGSADDVLVVVAGGDGRHSAWLAGWGVTRRTTQEVERPE